MRGIGTQKRGPYKAIDARLNEEGEEEEEAGSDAAFDGQKTLIKKRKKKKNGRQNACALVCNAENTDIKHQSIARTHA